MKVYDVVIDALKELNVRYIFGIPGTHIYHLYKSIGDKGGIKVIMTRHEQNSVFMADLYGRLTGRPGVSIVTAGPGATNGATGLAQAFSVSSPILYISGETPTTGFYEFHGLDSPLKTSESLTPLVKSSYTLLDPDFTYWSISRGFYISVTGRKGPVYISIPYDVISQDTSSNEEMDNMGRLEVRTQEYFVKEVVKRVLDGKRTLFLIGPEGSYPEINRKLSEVIDKHSLTYATFPCTIGVVPADKGFYSGFVEKKYVIYPALREVLKNVDIIVGFGVRPESPEVELIRELYPGIKWLFTIPSMYTRVLFEEQYDIDVSIKLIGGDYLIAGDLKQILNILDNVEYREINLDISEIIDKRLNRIVDALENYSNEKPLHQGIVAYKLSQIIPQDSVITSDAGGNEIWMREFILHRGGLRYVYAGSYGTLGFSFGSILAGPLTNRFKNYISIVGDGSFLMSIMELQTIAQYSLPVKVIVINDGEYGILKYFSRMEFGVELKYELGKVDYSRVAQEFGVEGLTVETEEELESLAHIFKTGKPFLVNVVASAKHIPTLFEERL